MRSPKETSWRKSRKFGDVFGGRTRAKLTDGIFQRLHPFAAPAEGEPIPILIEDNASKDFLFPISGHEALDALGRLPVKQVAGITHLWLRRVKTADFEAGNHPLAEFVCGGGVRLIVLYPWRRDMLLPLGAKKPSTRLRKRYAGWTNDLFQHQGCWFLRWTLESLRSFYIEGLLFHEVGHHVDWYSRRWSKANRKKVEEFADQYAVEWTARKPKEQRKETNRIADRRRDRDMPIVTVYHSPVTATSLFDVLVRDSKPGIMAKESVMLVPLAEKLIAVCLSDLGHCRDYEKGLELATIARPIE